MKKIIALTLGLSLAFSLNAAVVSIGGVPALYQSNIIENLDPNDVVPGFFGANANGEELIWLGIYESADDTVDVNLNNTGGGSQTGSVSLILSAGVATTWNINVGAGVDLDNIYVFSPATQVIANSGGSSIDVSGLIEVGASEPAGCGYSFPSNNQGCNTDLILGTDTGGENFFFDNYLGDTSNTLELTSFNGVYQAELFNVNVESAVVPVPAAVLLFMSALMSLLGLKARRAANA